jgi:hypothetical protein
MTNLTGGQSGNAWARPRKGLSLDQWKATREGQLCHAWLPQLLGAVERAEEQTVALQTVHRQHESGGGADNCLLQ